jgi:hypothetical protein
MNMADEIIIPYESEDINFLEALLYRMKDIKARLIIDIADDDDFLFNHCEIIFLALKKDYPNINFALRFMDYNKDMEAIYGCCLENKIPFFFRTYVQDLDTFHGLINMGVSDVYIVEEMGFILDTLGPIAHSKNVSIRVFANVCQTSWKYNKNSLKSFFIRPEDIPIYDSYVDVVEFFGSYDKQETMFRIYSINKKWYGNLQEIIQGLEEPLDSRYLPNIWAVARLSCEKRCLKGSPCSICTRLLDTTQLLKTKIEEL